jgi:hypothetical protein
VRDESLVTLRLASGTLRERLRCKRIRFSDGERALLARKAKPSSAIWTRLLNFHYREAA